MSEKSVVLSCLQEKKQGKIVATKPHCFSILF